MDGEDKKHNALKRLIKMVEDHSPKNYSLLLGIPVALLVFGFLVWNTYLSVFGLSEVDIVKAKFIAAGTLFVLITGFAYWLIKLIFKIIIYPFNRLKWNKGQSIRMGAVAWIILSFVWWFFYTLVLFPWIPGLFGGGQPIPLSFLVTDANMQLLNSIDVQRGTGAKNQTETLCEFNQDSNDIYVFESNRVLLIDKKDIDGYITLPGEINYMDQNTCIQENYDWIGNAVLYPVYATVVPGINVVLHLFHRQPVNVIQRCAPSVGSLQNSSPQ